VSGLTFGGQVVVAGKALRLLEANGIEVDGGHIVGQSVMFVIRVDAFDLLAARGELVEIKLGRAQPTDEISFHATIINEARLAQLPDVQVMSVIVQPLRDVVPALVALTWEAIVEPPVDQDVWPVPF
jgi:hypothetical protein